MNTRFQWVGALTALSMSLLPGCLLPGGDGDGNFNTVVSALEGGYLCDARELVHLWVPPNALSEDTRITLDIVDRAEELAEYDLIEPGVDFGPDGTQFNEPVWVTYHYDGKLPAGADPQQLSLVALSANGDIEELADVYVDTSAQTVSGSITHFTQFFAFLKGPIVGGPSIQVGGPDLSPLYGVATVGNEAWVNIWVGPTGEIRTDPYSADSVDTLVIQMQSDAMSASGGLQVDTWVTDPVDPGSVLNELDEKISTTGWWHDTFFSQFVRNPLITLPPDNDGTVVHAISGQQLQNLILQHPVGYSSGRIHIRATSLSDPTQFVDLHLSFGKSPYL